MKQMLYITAVISCLLLTSCHTTEKFYVYGTPGTEIYTPDKRLIANVASDGKVKINVSSDAYFAFFLSKAPSSQTYVPFALDYKKKRHMGTKIVNGMAWPISIGGTGAMLIGAIGLLGAGDDEDGSSTMGTIIGAGGAAALVGSIAGMISENRLDQKTYDYNFGYLSSQKTNDDIRFTNVTFTEPYKNYKPSTSASQSSNEVTTTPTATPTSSATSRKHIAQKSTKTLKDFGEKVEGEYTGNGLLTKGKETIEEYAGISVKIERVSNDVVTVNVIDADGSQFFESASRYKVTKKSDGSFVLTNEDFRIATITIDKNGNLLYVHPKVNIDGDVYKLTINVK